MIYTYENLNNYADILILPDEVWKDHPIIPDLRVSSFGRVLAKGRTIFSKNQRGSFSYKVKDKIMKANPDSKGYPQLVFLKKNYRVHRLVAETFLNPPSESILKEYEKLENKTVFVNHKDKNILNANYLNLEWCTPSYNNTYLSDRVYKKGSNHVNTKLTDQDVLAILDLIKNKSMSQQNIAELFGIKQITVSNIKTGRSWTHLTNIEKTPCSPRKTVTTESLSSS